MRTLLFCFLVLLFYLPVAAQTSDEKAIRLVIDNLWLGMEKGDTNIIRKSFTDDVTFASIYRSKAEGPVIRREEALREFLQAAGTPHEDTWYEETWNYRIQIADDFASVWCDYAFYLGNTFSHCGVDAFHLHKSEQGWKIFHLTDTRKRLQCDIPQEIRAKHK